MDNNVYIFSGITLVTLLLSTADFTPNFFSEFDYIYPYNKWYKLVVIAHNT